MPNVGISRSSTALVSAVGPSVVAGSPGPLARKKPSGSSARTSSIVAVAGSTWVSMPRWDIMRGVLVLMPMSSAATRNRVSPAGGTT